MSQTDHKKQPEREKGKEREGKGKREGKRKRGGAEIERESASLLLIYLVTIFQYFPNVLKVIK